jgi:hypothetical protein
MFFVFGIQNTGDEGQEEENLSLQLQIRCSYCVVITKTLVAVMSDE